jgi:RNA polymerase sigma-70 factor (ECF subfamily)
MTARPEPDPDAELAARASRGDAAAFDQLVAHWKERVFQLAHRFFARPQDAEDVAQEVFLKMYRALPTYRSDAPFEHWLMRIATNACRDQLRERRRRPATPLAELTADAPVWLDRALAGRALAAAESVAARLAAAELLATLPVKDRIVLVLLDVEGRSTEEVAALVGSTRAAVKVRAFRARRALRELAAQASEGRR